MIEMFVGNQDAISSLFVIISYAMHNICYRINLDGMTVVVDVQTGMSIAVDGDLFSTFCFESIAL